MKNKNFERELPRGYKEDFHIDARDKKTAILLSFGSFAITAVVFALLLIHFFNSGVDLSDIHPISFFLFYFIFVVSMLLYVVLHELVHGVVYKVMTGEKLTFGITPAAAFCGVPNIYTYRRCALFALLAPLVIFTVIFVPMQICSTILDFPLFSLCTSEDA